MAASFAGADLGYGRPFETYAFASQLPDLIMPLPFGARAMLPRFITDDVSPPVVAMPGKNFAADDFAPEDFAPADLAASPPDLRGAEATGSPSSSDPALPGDAPPPGLDSSREPASVVPPETDDRGAGEASASVPDQPPPRPPASGSDQPPAAPDIAVPTSGPSSPDFVPLPDSRTLRVR